MSKTRRTSKNIRIKKLNPRDYVMAVTGAILVFIGVSMADSLHTKPVPLAMRGGITIPWIPASVKHWEPAIKQTAQTYNLDANLVAIIMTIESGGNPQAKSGVGAQGLMQIMPGTATDIAAKHLKQPTTSYDIFNPQTNIEFGVSYLAYLRNEFGSSEHGPDWDKTAELIAAGYNGGPGAASRLQKGQGLESLETSSYARDVLGMWRERNAAHSPTYDRWSGRGGSSLVDAATAAQ